MTALRKAHEEKVAEHAEELERAQEAHDEKAVALEASVRQLKGARQAHERATASQHENKKLRKRRDQLLQGQDPEALAASSPRIIGNNRT